MICFYQGTYGERIHQTIKGIEPFIRHKSVDRVIIIVDETVTEEQKKALLNMGCEVYIHPWLDSMVRMRNQALEKIQTYDWVITSDPDEFFCEKFCEEVRFIVMAAEEKGLNLLLINSHDLTIQEDGSGEPIKSTFYKNLIYRKEWGTHYEGVGERTRTTNECFECGYREVHNA